MTFLGIRSRNVKLATMVLPFLIAVFLVAVGKFLHLASGVFFVVVLLVVVVVNRRKKSIWYTYDVLTLKIEIIH